MARASRLRDLCTRHDSCPEVRGATASEDTSINGSGALRYDDLFSAHGCSAHRPHQDRVIEGCPSVFVNDRPLARVGDALDRGNTVKTGSPNVFAYDGVPDECRCMKEAFSQGAAFVVNVETA